MSIRAQYWLLCRFIQAAHIQLQSSMATWEQLAIKIPLSHMVFPNSPQTVPKWFFRTIMLSYCTPTKVSHSTISEFFGKICKCFPSTVLHFYFAQHLILWTLRSLLHRTHSSCTDSYSSVNQQSVYLTDVHLQTVAVFHSCRNRRQRWIEM